MSNMVVNTNILALNAHRALKGIGTMQTKASNRLSSGLRINTAADDAAGLAISEKMRAQIKGLDMASRNAQDAISLAQTAEGGMQEIDNMIQRIRELVVQASNDTNEWELVTGADRQKIQDEISQLVEEIDSMSSRVEFNKKRLINGSFAATAVDTATHNAYVVSRNNLDAAISAAIEAKHKITLALNDSTATGFTGALNALKMTTEYRTGTITKLVDDAIAEIAAQVDKARGATTSSVVAQATLAISAQAGSRMKALLDAVATLGVSATTQVEVQRLIGAVTSAVTQALNNYSTTITALNKAQATFNTAKAAYDADVKVEGIYFQVGANAQQKLELSINSVNSNFLGLGDGKGNTTIDVVRASGRDITDILTTIDRSLTYVTTERAKLGAVQNRLEFTIKSLDISSENLSASESRIRDADMAKEMMSFTKSNVLQQAGTAMLAQANQAPQSILRLLQ